ncbi:hypothetical protein QYM36_011559 [Artemia franciscana]|uniref:Uncharacterized protein n=1 Tax=Artemia franciscana TaxID=6661 RepID=A0AA88HNU2_ARTSF|nr:hypothetical protein QYM36_011559 [Artemia franciscana]
MKRTSNDTSLSCWESILLGNFQGIDKACSWKVTAKLSTTEGIVRISASEVVITNKFKLGGSCICNITFVSFPLVISSSYEFSLWCKDTVYRLTPQNLVNAKNITTKIINFPLKYILRGYRSIFAKEKSKNLVKSSKKMFKEAIEWRQLYNDVVEENEIALTQADVVVRVIRAESVQLTELLLVASTIGILCIILFSLTAGWVIYQIIRIKNVTEEITELQALTVTREQLRVRKEYADYVGVGC